MTTASLSLEISPALTPSGETTWPGAVWVGEVWRESVDALEQESAASGHPVRCPLNNAEGYGRARLLVRSPGRVHGFIELDIRDGELNFTDLAQHVARAAGPAEPGSSPQRQGRTRSATVVMSTRNRPHLVPIALEAILGLDYPDFDVIVVDNASDTTATADYVRAHPDPRVRLVVEPKPGLSRGRNAGLWVATGDIVAFVDDDAIVDRFWLTAMVAAFDSAESVGCVSGLVPAGELRTPSQAEFDGRVSWSTAASDPRVFEWNSAPDDIPLFPFAVGEYGTGANLALDRETAVRLGGFDENLGAGVPACGGEDCDIFFRVLRSGKRLVREPAAIVWHRHRDSAASLDSQMRIWGTGQGAWLAKIAANPATAALAAKVVITRASALRQHAGAASQPVAPSGLLLRGAWEYGRARLRARREALSRT